MGMVSLTFDLWPFDLETGMLVASKVETFIPNLGMLGLRVLELFASLRDGQTDGQKQSLLPASLRVGA